MCIRDRSHVGLARRLARDEGARIRRRDVIVMAGAIRSVGDAIGAAHDLATIAEEESGACLLYTSVRSGSTE